VVFKPFGLFVAGFEHPFTDALAVLRCPGRGQFAEGNGRYLYVQVYTVKQGAAYLIQVFLNHKGGAGAFFFGVVEVATGALMRWSFAVLI
jgi:hypothetical protein